MTVTLTTVNSIYFNPQNTFGKVIDHVNNNPTIYQSYGPQSGLEKKKKMEKVAMLQQIVMNRRDCQTTDQ